MLFDVLMFAVAATPDPAMTKETMRAVGTVGGVAALVNTAMWFAQQPVASGLWKPLPWWAKPLALLGMTGCGGTLAAVATGMEPAAAALTSLVGLASAVAGPSWKPIWEEAQREKAEEDEQERVTAPGFKLPPPPKE